MSTYSVTDIGEVQKFNPADYPNVVSELTELLKQTGHFPVYFKREIVISYLKDHSLNNNWINANPELAKLITSGAYVTKDIELLFQACRWNKAFRSDLELYIRTRLSY
jgi:hypothetical protein